METESREAYPTDLTEEQWEQIQDSIPPLVSRGPKNVNYERREIVNAILYLLRAGCSWRMLPHDLPPWQIVYFWYRTWYQQGVWDTLCTQLRKTARQKAGREQEPTAACLDSQTVQGTDTCLPSGLDAAKKKKGRKGILLSIPWEICWLYWLARPTSKTNLRGGLPSSNSAPMSLLSSKSGLTRLTNVTVFPPMHVTVSVSTSR